LEPKKLVAKKKRAVIFDIGRVLVRLDIAGAMGGSRELFRLRHKKPGRPSNTIRDGAIGRKAACRREIGSYIFAGAWE
jgi:hypothetical protein